MSWWHMSSNLNCSVGNSQPCNLGPRFFDHICCHLSNVCRLKAPEWFQVFIYLSKIVQYYRASGGREFPPLIKVRRGRNGIPTLIFHYRLLQCLACCSLTSPVLESWLGFGHKNVHGMGSPDVRCSVANKSKAIKGCHNYEHASAH